MSTYEVHVHLASVVLKDCVLQGVVCLAFRARPMPDSLIVVIVLSARSSDAVFIPCI